MSYSDAISGAGHGPREGNREESSIDAVAPGKVSRSSRMRGPSPDDVERELRELEAIVSDLRVYVKLVDEAAELCDPFQLPMNLRYVRSQLSAAAPKVTMLRRNLDILRKAGSDGYFEELTIEVGNLRRHFQPLIEQYVTRPENPGQRDAEKTLAPLDPDVLADVSGTQPPTGETGVAGIDHGFACQDLDEATPGCFLTQKQEAELLRTLSFRVMGALGALRSAVAAKQLGLLITEEKGWGFVAEVVFNVLSFTSVGAIVKGLTRIKAEATEIATAMPSRISSALVATPVQGVEGALGHVGRGLRTHFKNAASALPPEARAQADFLALLEDEAGLYAQQINELAPVMLDHAELLALSASFSAEFHSTTHYLNELDALLARHQALGIRDIGKDVERFGVVMGRREVVAFHAHDRLRRAVVVRSGNPEAVSGTFARMFPERIYFVDWIDDPFIDVAEALQRSRVGGVRIIDVTADAHHIHELPATQNGVPPRSSRIDDFVTGAAAALATRAAEPVDAAVSALAGLW